MWQTGREPQVVRTLFLVRASATASRALCHFALSVSSEQLSVFHGHRRWRPRWHRSYHDLLHSLVEGKYKISSIGSTVLPGVWWEHGIYFCYRGCVFWVCGDGWFRLNAVLINQRFFFIYLVLLCVQHLRRIIKSLDESTVLFFFCSCVSVRCKLLAQFYLRKIFKDPWVHMLFSQYVM